MVGEYMKPFIDASIEVIGSITGLKPVAGDAYNKSTIQKKENLAVLIGLSGKVQGNFTVEFEPCTACKIASLMMGGFPVPSLDEIAKSAVAELVNMISGNAVTIFEKTSIDMHITPPAVITGEELNRISLNYRNVCVPLVFESGELLELNLAI